MLLFLLLWSFACTGGEQNRKTRKLMNRIYVGYIERTSVGNIECSFFRLFTLCSARVSSLVIVLSDCPSERIGKLETCLMLKEDRSLVRV
jgi:hypothetical protein